MWPDEPQVLQGLLHVFRAEGQTAEISGNNPFLLDSRERVWMVLSGGVEVFAVKCEGQRIVGRREHFFSVAPGGCLFGMEVEEYGLGQAFQAVGLPGTTVACLPLSRLAELAGHEECRPEVAALVDDWLEALSRGLTKDIVPRPKSDVLIAPGQALRVESQKVLSSADGVVWVELSSGSCLYLGMHELEAGQGPFPISPKSWMVSLDPGEIAVLKTGVTIHESPVWRSLDAFHEMVFQILLLNTGLAAADDYNLLLQKAAADREAQEAGLAQLAGIMGQDRAASAVLASRERAFAVCSLVAERQGIVLQAPPQARRQASRSSTVGEILDASRVNSRKVTLRSGWWKEDNGPLIGFLEQDQTPVALLPVSRTRYQIVDPTTGGVTGVNRTVAKQLSPVALTLYRPFDEQRVSGKDLVRFALRGSGRDVWRALVLGAIIGVCGLLLPIATGIIFDSVIPQAQRSMLLQIVVILVCFSVTNFLFEIPRSMALLRTEVKACFTLDAAFWDRLLRLPIPFFRDYTAGDLAMRTMGFAMSRQMLASSGLMGTLAAFVFALFAFPLLFYYQYQLAGVVTGMLVLAAVVVLGLQVLQVRRYRELMEIQGSLSGRVLQFMSAISKLRVAGAENRAFSLWARQFSRQKTLAFQAGRFANLQATFLATFPVLSLMAMFAWVGLVMKQPGDMTVGDFMAFNAAWASLCAAMVQMASGLGALAQVAPLYQRAKPILQARPEVDVRRSAPADLVGRVEVCHVSFRYAPEAPMVLRDVSIRVEPGEFVALVGPSGSGKSTLLRLLLGFDAPTSGAIYYDDQDLSEMDLSGIRRNLGVVMQDATVMPGSVFTNIVGARPLVLDDAWEAARMAGLDEDLKQMPMGMHTVVTENGATLSGGQRQRLMIARAIVNRPRILMFDEATASLDNRTQAIVNESLRRMTATRIVIAHRLSTVKDADRIHVIDHGEVVEAGKYEELLARGGLFARMARRQIA
ncbi:MAG: NHLP bacteriocin export ABC transporter permease/ATPase subunit [Acidobacteria bacterium]|nr:MAG: NHLP bacteriocin export ABC transporter permease/ATPase subunit [Acidobacteriota bacterium]